MYIIIIIAIVATIIWIGVGLRCWFHETISTNQYKHDKKCIMVSDLLSIPVYMMIGIFFMMIGIFFSFVDSLIVCSKIVIWEEKE